MPHSLPDRDACVYDQVCHALAVRSRPECRALLFAPHPHFSTHGLSFCDMQAAALASAMLVRYGAPRSLVQRFLAVFTNGAACPNIHAPTNHSIHPPQKRARPFPSRRIDFSSNPDLTPRGAAVILAACLLAPGDAHVQLDLHLCTAVTSIDLQPWFPFLVSERSAHHSQLPTLRGLRLDGCPLRQLDPYTLDALRDLKWISLRATLMANLWRTAEIVNSLPSLVAFIINGSLADSTVLIQTKKLCHMLDSDHQTAPAQSTHCNPRLSSQHNDDMCISAADHSTLPSPHPVEAQKTDQLMATDDNFAFANQALLHASTSSSFTAMDIHALLDRRTPVTSSPYFEAFLVARAHPSLQMLDGKRITTTERLNAKHLVHAHFELEDSNISDRSATSISALLRNREFGLSPILPLTDAPICSPINASSKKRRRITNTACPSANTMAPAVSASSTTPMSVSESLSAALATATSAVQLDVDISVRRAREAFRMLSSEQQRHRSGEVRNMMVPAPSVVPNASQSNHCKETHRFMRSKLTSYSDESFAKAMSSALVYRPGAPRIEYLCQKQDRPRQFEFNPANPSELVYGTEQGYLVVLDQETGEVKGSCKSGGGHGNRTRGEVIGYKTTLDDVSRIDNQLGRHRMPSAPVYGLSWLNKRSDCFISGSNDGSIHLYNVNWMRSGERGGCMYACETFDNLTSIHVSCDDAKFAVSGCSRHVGLFDLTTGRQTELLHNCHTQSINVIKFAHTNPHILVTSSFDQYVKKWDLRESRPGGGRRPVFQTRSRTDNVMVCLSPDDSRLLVSAVDNEVRQYLAGDGRLEREFEIPKTGSAYNFTRSYYMNNRDYIISGSCREHVVRVFNARTGSFLAEVEMDNRDTVQGSRLCVQSLRANPGKRFNFSALLVSKTDSTYEVIANADLLAR